MPAKVSQANLLDSLATELEPDRTVNVMAAPTHALFKPVLGAVLTVVCGLALWAMPLGERWVDASYDYLFRFGARRVPNKPVVILMDNLAHHELRQSRGAWDRGLHAQLLNQLARDGCPLVILDVFFGGPRDPEKDQALVEAMRQLTCVVLVAKQMDVALKGARSAAPTLPAEPFRTAAKGNWGVAWLQRDLDSIVRQHWPFEAPNIELQYQSLPWEVALRVGAHLSEKPEKRWLRYYWENEGWDSLSYHLALSNSPGYFRGKTVFIGSKPEYSDASILEDDKYRTPYTRWTGEATGGAEIMATEFLNLVNGDWLRRPAGWIEAGMLAVTGVMFGGGLGRSRRLPACALAAGAALVFTLGAVSLSYFTNYWIPWLVVVGGQIPCAVAWSVLTPQRRPEFEAATRTEALPPGSSQVPEAASSSLTFDLPEAPDYEFFDPPFAEGAYGKVWLARNAIGQWQALKAVYLAKFGAQTHPYDREFNGIRMYKPISDKHPGLLRVDFVSVKKPGGYFYYVMELGDGFETGWQGDPARYVPRDLAKVRARAPGHRLPSRECLRIVISLAEALEFLHAQGLTHRDIKPSNIIFVNNRAKLADVGLVAEVWPPDKEKTWVGTPGYMPPPPEPPGTPRADIYGLGMVLYVILTGREPAFFPEIATTLGDETNAVDVRCMTAIVLKACQPDVTQRFSSAHEMLAALVEAEKGFDL